jgi:hypothetical protein
MKRPLLSHWKILTTLKAFYDYNSNLTIDISRYGIEELLELGYLEPSDECVIPENMLMHTVSKKGVRFILRSTPFERLWEDYKISSLAFNKWS